ncbi:MAG: hypothetical protein ACFFC7_33430 [Candidatus Hermodarchaeota archaeon]
MDKRSWILILFLPVFNSALFVVVLPFSGFWNPIQTTVSEILGNPLFWVGKRVSVRGSLYPPITEECPSYYCPSFVYRDISPFDCALIDENDSMIGLILFYQRKVSWWDYFINISNRPEVVTGRVLMVYCWEGVRVCIAVESVRFSQPNLAGQTSKIDI